MMWNGNVLIFRGWISHNFQRFIVGELLDGIECNYLSIFPQIISICEWSIPWTLCKSAMEVESISMCCIGYVIASTSTSMHGDVIRGNGNIFRVTGPLCGEFTGHRRIPRTKASDTELWCFLWSAAELTIEQTLVRLVIWDAIVLIMTSS